MSVCDRRPRWLLTISIGPAAFSVVRWPDRFPVSKPVSDRRNGNVTGPETSQTLRMATRAGWCTVRSMSNKALREQPYDSDGATLTRQKIAVRIDGAQVDGAQGRKNCESDCRGKPQPTPLSRLRRPSDAETVCMPAVETQILNSGSDAMSENPSRLSSEEVRESDTARQAPG